MQCTRLKLSIQVISFFKDHNPISLLIVVLYILLLLWTISNNLRSFTLFQLVADISNGIGYH